ncbi:hypothetical protein [Nostoc sp. C052]|uniref:hypothetical protein n=1 Tax=Nostoc sp. C052 TaxID=2576902 RepID=UPI0015C3C3D3|nr:hypothetical protein [Nostoc sp. C052]
MKGVSKSLDERMTEDWEILPILRSQRPKIPSCKGVEFFYLLWGDRSCLSELSQEF